MSRVCHDIDRIQVSFDDETLVANAGLLLVSTLMVRLGVEALVDSSVRLTGCVGGSRPGRKAATLVQSIVAGVDGGRKPGKEPARGRCGFHDL